MKKILSFVILGILLVGLAAPILAGAQDQKVKECCTIGQPINLDDTGATVVTKCDAKAIAAPDTTAGAACNSGAAPSAVCGGEKWGMYCLVNTVYNVTNWLFYLMIVAVVIVFVIAGAMYMMAGGDSEKTKGAKGMMIYGIVGLVIALIAKLVPSVVKLIVGM